MSSAAPSAAPAAGHLRGILLIVAAVCAFSVLDSIGKYLTRHYPIPLVIWARYFFHVLIMAVLLAPRMGRKLVQTRRPDLQVARGVALGLSTVFFIGAISRMPLAEASAITQIAPVLLAIMAVRVLGERAPPGTWWALGVSLFGVLLIARPGGQVFTWVALLPIGTALCAAVYQLLTRRLAGVDDGMATLFLGGLVATVGATGFLPLVWQLPRSPLDGVLFVAMGAVGAFSHLLLVQAFQRAPASRLAPFMYLQVVSSLLLGWLIFGDFPDLTAMAGIALIALTGVAMALPRKGLLRRAARADVSTEEIPPQGAASTSAAPVVAAGGTAAVTGSAAGLAPSATQPSGAVTGAAPAPVSMAATPAVSMSSVGTMSTATSGAASVSVLVSPSASLPVSVAASSAGAAALADAPAMTASRPPAAGPVATARAPMRGILLVVGACVLFALLDAIAKYLSRTHHPIMVAWARYVFHVVIMVPLFVPMMGRRLFVTRRPMLQVARGLCLGLSSICFFTSVSLMPLAEATAIAAIAPVFVTVGAVIWLKEKAPPGTWWALALSFAGVMLIVRPGTALFGLPALLPLVTALCTMAYQLLTRQLAGVDNGLATLFIGGVVAAVLLTVVSPGTWSLPTGPLDAVLFVAMGAIGALSHLMLVRAFELAPASSLAPFGYMHGVAALVFGLVVFGQFPDQYGLAGLALIVVTGVTMALRGRVPRLVRTRQ